jgi:hypothetical protein
MTGGIQIMKTGTLILAGLLLGGPALASAQATAVETATGTLIVSGEVVRFEPGKMLVVRNSDGTEKSYMLTPQVVIPAEVQVGRQVSVHTLRGADGATSVTRVTTSVTPEGQVKKTTEQTRTDTMGTTTKTTTTTIEGKVQTYLPGKSITVLKADGSAVTFTVPEGSRVPPDIAVGRTVTVRTLPNGTVVETITIHKPE